MGEVNERPMLFSAPMVRALLAGTKTQTRRVMARQKQHDFTDYTLFGQHGHPEDEAERRGGWAQPWVAIEHSPDWPDGKEDQCYCPHARRKGDQLWVREAWRVGSRHDQTAPRDLKPRSMSVAYEAGGSAGNFNDGWRIADHTLTTAAYIGKLRPGMFMPRWASRIQLEVTGLRIERLQDISEADAAAEGISRDEHGWTNYLNPLECCWSPKDSYRTLWESINGTGSWDTNPWVWAVSFRRLKP